MPAPGDTKQTRLNIRISEHEKDVITRAAAMLNTSVSHFVLGKAYSEAQAVLADQTRIRLPPRKWRAFCKALDAPPKEIPALRRLLTRPGVFDE